MHAANGRWEVEDKAGAMSYMGALFATLSGIATVQETVAIIGVLLGVATFAVNFHFKRRDSEAARAAYDAKERWYQIKDGDK